MFIQDLTTGLRIHPKAFKFDPPDNTFQYKDFYIEAPSSHAVYNLGILVDISPVEFVDVKIEPHGYQLVSANNFRPLERNQIVTLDWTVPEGSRNRSIMISKTKLPTKKKVVISIGAKHKQKIVVTKIVYSKSDNGINVASDGSTKYTPSIQPKDLIKKKGDRITSSHLSVYLANDT